MAKLPSIRRLQAQDYPGADTNFIQLIGNLNSFMESVYIGLSRNLTVSENLRAAYQTLTAQDSGYPITITPAISSPSAVLVAQATDVDSRGAATGTTLAGGVMLDWSLSSTGSVLINKITGLTAGRTYLLKLLLVG